MKCGGGFEDFDGKTLAVFSLKRRTIYIRKQEIRIKVKKGWLRKEYKH